MKLILIVSTLAIILNGGSVHAAGNHHSGLFSLAVAPGNAILLYSDNVERYIALTVCNDRNSVAPVQILANGGRSISAVAAGNCGTLLVNAASVGVFGAGNITGNYLVTVLAEFGSV